jgi:hypothetical protein
MNRCLPGQSDQSHPFLPFCRRLLTRFIATSAWAVAVVIAIAPGFLPADALAQAEGRPFPAAAKRGILQVTEPPNLLINGASERLSPGSRIRGENNMLVMSGQLVGQSVLVNYTRNAQGMIHEVWILTAIEAQQERSGMEPITNFVFGSDADKPKVDDGKTPFDQLPKYKQ